MTGMFQGIVDTKIRSINSLLRKGKDMEKLGSGSGARRREKGSSAGFDPVGRTRPAVSRNATSRSNDTLTA